jgi:hypothetical protein
VKRAKPAELFAEQPVRGQQPERLVARWTPWNLNHI